MENMDKKLTVLKKSGRKYPKCLKKFQPKMSAQAQKFEIFESSLRVSVVRVCMHIFCYGLPNPVQTRTPDGKVAKSATSNIGLKFFLKYHSVITIRLWTFQDICLKVSKS